MTRRAGRRVTATQGGLLALVVALVGASASAQPATPPDPDLARLDAVVEAFTTSIDAATPTLEQIGASVQRLCSTAAADQQRTCRAQQARAMLQFGLRPTDATSQACLRAATSSADDFVDATGRRLPIVDFVAALACDTARR